MSVLMLQCYRLGEVGMPDASGSDACIGCTHSATNATHSWLVLFADSNMCSARDPARYSIQVWIEPRPRPEVYEPLHA